jgi:mannose-6-phosphate isomerase
MGTHPSGPAKIYGSDEMFLEWITKHADVIGWVPKDYTTEVNLPFMFKVLSINTALSIQAHPCKSLAKKLYKEFPHIYKDANHKPEMAIALTKFEGLCGFRDIEDVAVNLREFPECDCINESMITYSGSPTSKKKKDKFAELFHTFMHWSEEHCKERINLLVNRLSAEKSGDPHLFAENPLKELMLKLHEQYPYDKGIFCPLFLNYVVLEVGESFYMAANEPHAYISGDIVECMALSDNVVRCALTPKFKDVDTLCSMLTYTSGPVQLVTPTCPDQYTKNYRPDPYVCTEFEVEKTDLPLGVSHTLSSVDVGSILVVIEGSGTANTRSPLETVLNGTYHKAPNGIRPAMGEEETQVLSKGMVYFQSANMSTSITNTGAVNFQIFRAHVNLASVGMSRIVSKANLADLANLSETSTDMYSMYSLDETLRKTIDACESEIILQVL